MRAVSLSRLVARRCSAAVLLAGLLVGVRAGAAETQTPAAARSNLIDRLAPIATGLRRDVLALAVRAYEKARQRGELRREVLTVIDYTLPSAEKRMWVLDVAAGRLLFHERVAHGRGSGDAVAQTFSNSAESHQSSLGTFITGHTYEGKHGYSLLLEGMEPGINDAARRRAVVIHGADYMTDAYVAKLGRAGRSWGCPALDPQVTPKVIDCIKEGSLIWAYYPDPALLARSGYLR